MHIYTGAKYYMTERRRPYRTTLTPCNLLSRCFVPFRCFSGFELQIYFITRTRPLVRRPLAISKGISYLRSLVVRAVHRHRTRVGSPTGGPYN